MTRLKPDQVIDGNTEFDGTFERPAIYAWRIQPNKHNVTVFDDFYNQLKTEYIIDGINKLTKRPHEVKIKRSKNRAQLEDENLPILSEEKSLKIITSMIPPVYIGETQNIKVRFKQHYSKLKQYLNLVRREIQNSKYPDGDIDDIERILSNADIGAEEDDYTDENSKKITKEFAYYASTLVYRYFHEMDTTKVLITPQQFVCDVYFVDDLDNKQRKSLETFLINLCNPILNEKYHV